jgi:aryl-alcohol dehydrogenase
VPGSTVVVFGAGGAGLVAVMAAMLTSAARVVAVDVNAARLELASELGATDTVNPADGDPVAALIELTGGLGAQCAIETSGRLTVLDQAISSLSSAGTCVVIGAPPLGFPSTCRTCSVGAFAWLARIKETATPVNSFRA